MAVQYLESGSSSRWIKQALVDPACEGLNTAGFDDLSRDLNKRIEGVISNPQIHHSDWNGVATWHHYSQRGGKSEKDRAA